MFLAVFSGSEVGLALSKSLALLFVVQYGIRQLCEIICQMTSVERILQYTIIETEGPFNTAKGSSSQFFIKTLDQNPHIFKM